MTNQQRSSSYKEAERKRKVAILTDKHRPLSEHWTGRYVFLDANESEFNYKHHLTKLKDIYTTYQSEFLATINTDPRDGFKNTKKVTTRLFGTHGLKSTAPFVPKWEEKRESTWDDEINIESIRDKYKSHTSTNGFSTRPWSPSIESSPSKVTRPSLKPVNELSPIKAGNKYERIQPTWLRYKCSDEMTDEDATLLGLYRLNEEQNDSYYKFVMMLAEFDSFEMKKILADAVNDVNALTSLKSYHGTSLPDLQK